MLALQCYVGKGFSRVKLTRQQDSVSLFVMNNYVKTSNLSTVPAMKHTDKRLWYILFFLELL